MEEYKGFIYVLTNPSFPEYVKIGYADNVDERVAQLNRTECTPFAFRKYAVLPVRNRLADKNVHKLIDTFAPELRARENINGKIRTREFFSMPVAKAVDLLSIIGDFYGEVPEICEQTAGEKSDQKNQERDAIDLEKRSPFSFYKCGIHNGENIVYAHDHNIVCKVVGDREIRYNNENTSLSALAKKLLKQKNSVQGTLHFEYNGEILSALRKRLENEGKYLENVEIQPYKEPTNQYNSKSDDEVLLYFTMAKYPAKCRWSKDGYLLLEGSKISQGFTPSCQQHLKNLRSKYKNCINEEGIVIKPIMFTSSSSAAGFVTGSSKNGKTCWMNEKGVLLCELLKNK